MTERGATLSLCLLSTKDLYRPAALQRRIHNEEALVDSLRTPALS
jgi:hypothetical protein